MSLKHHLFNDWIIYTLQKLRCVQNFFSESFNVFRTFILLMYKVILYN